MIFDNVKAGSHQNLTVEDLRHLLVALPPLDEQSRIANLLTDIETQIANLSELITKKTKIKQGAMQELLTGKTRLPGYTGNWDAIPLGEICKNFVNGGTPSTKKSSYWSGTIPWISGADIVQQKVGMVRRYITQKP